MIHIEHTDLFGGEAIEQFIADIGKERDRRLTTLPIKAPPEATPEDRRQPSRRHAGVYAVAATVTGSHEEVRPRRSGFHRRHEARESPRHIAGPEHHHTRTRKVIHTDFP
jgi:hypothetical protein